MNGRRLCLGCLSDWAEPGSAQCYMCDAECARSRKTSHRRYVHADEQPVEWWGPTLMDINPEDVQFGFHEVDFHPSDPDEWGVQMPNDEFVSNRAVTLEEMRKVGAV